MISLGIHTASQPYSIGLVVLDKNGATIKQASRSNLGGYAFSENLVSEIHTLCDENGVKKQDIQVIGVTHGPGSYTGIRIGITVAKSMAQTLSIPIHSFCALKSQVLPFIGTKQIYLSMLPARQNELNCAIFSTTKTHIKRITPLFCLAKEKLNQTLEKIKGKIIITGSIPDDIKQIIQTHPTTQMTSSTIDATLLAKTAIENTAQNINGDYKTITPQYSHEPNVG